MERLSTERLIIRKFRESDCEEFYKYSADAEMSRMMGRDRITDHEPGGYVLELQETGQVVGNLTITEPSELVASNPETVNKIGKALSFCVSREFQRKGLMTEALRGVIRYLFRVEHVNYISCGYFGSNLPLKNLQEELGFSDFVTESIQRNGTTITVTEQILWNPCKIRYATAADYERVEEIMQEVHILHMGWRPDIYRAAETIYPRKYFNRCCEEQRVLVAERHGVVVGHLTFVYRHVASDKFLDRTVLFVDDLAVKAEYRGQGIGSELLSTVKEKVHWEHLDGLELQVNARNTAAKKMYEKFGFTEKSINMELL